MKIGRKAVAVALALMLLGAIGASAANAASFTSAATGKTLVTGSQVNKLVFTTDTGNVECTGATFTGEFSGSSVSSITLLPSYSGCVALGFAATITTNNCTYVINASGTADLACPSGKDIVIDTAFNLCNFTIPSQTGLSSISYANGTVDGKTDITATFDITNIAYTEPDTFGCLNRGKNTTKGALTGSVTLRGQDPLLGFVNLTYDP